MNLTGEQRYWQAMKKARLQFARDIRLEREGKILFIETCLLQRERESLIAEFDRLSLATRDAAA